MEIQSFYAIPVVACFTVVGICWSAIRGRKDSFRDEATRRLAGDVHASFLIPALLSMGAQISSTAQPVLWRIMFIVAGALGIYFSERIFRQMRAGDLHTPFDAARRALPPLYGIIVLFALFPGLTRLAGLQPLQTEGLILTVLILTAHKLTWEFMACSIQKVSSSFERSESYAS